MWRVLCCLLFLISFCRWILPLNEQRQRLCSLHDPLLHRLPNFDTSIVAGTMSVILPCLLCVDKIFYDHWWRLEQVLIIYTCTLATKSITMYVTPLEVPNGYIPLMDPISRMLAGPHVHISRDLMFSGHTSMALVCTFSIVHFPLRVLATCSTVLLICCLLINRVHYSIDIIVAYFVTHAWCVFIENGVEEYV